jgi:hypothetical protein
MSAAVAAGAGEAAAVWERVCGALLERTKRMDDSDRTRILSATKARGLLAG